MISHVLIRDFATIENIEVDFHRGLNIITGETGAGKSVVINAISLALGARADTTYVRTGCEKSLIQMVAEINNRDYVITREVYASGKSLCKVDGEVVSLGELKKLTQQIADIHGQYDNQYLLIPENHIKLIDTYDKNNIKLAKSKVADAYAEFKQADSKLQELFDMNHDNDRRKDFLKYEINEIKEANLMLGEDTILKEKLDMMKHNEEIFNALNGAYDAGRNSNFNALDALSKVISELRNVSSTSKEAAFIEDEVSDIYYRFDDVCTRLRESRDKCVVSPAEIDETNDRYYLICQLKKKYGDTIDAILDHKEAAEKELRTLVNLDSEIQSMLMEKESLESILKDETARLTTLRKNAAANLEEAIQAELENLNFGEVSLSISFGRKDSYSPEGIDTVEILISTNKGEKLKPLSKIASGGEMSRIMLAFKKIITEFDDIPTIIFDEIDSGISGETAIIVGKAISSLAETRQILTITHLPQIASYGDFNYKITKDTDDSSTYTTIQQLTENEKVGEIARLIAGLDASELTMQSAMEMIGAHKR